MALLQAGAAQAGGLRHLICVTLGPAAAGHADLQGSCRLARTDWPELQHRSWSRRLNTGLAATLLRVTQTLLSKVEARSL